MRVREDCRECRGRMEPGFMLDTMYGGRMEGRWTPGPIETGLLGGVRIGERGAYSVIAYRCVDCGRLELYA